MHAGGANRSLLTVTAVKKAVPVPSDDPTVAGGPAYIRAACTKDAEAIQGLLRQLGYETPTETVAERLELLRSTGIDQVSVAEQAERVVGVVMVHWRWRLHAARPMARIDTLVVDGPVRRQGIGRRLVQHAIALSRQAGCGGVELTTAKERAEAQGFYRRLGFVSTSLRFHQGLD